jgi:hypothetical protein
MKKELSYYDEMKALDRKITRDIKITNYLWWGAITLLALAVGCMTFLLLTLLIQ